MEQEEGTIRYKEKIKYLDGKIDMDEYVKKEEYNKVVKERDEYKQKLEIISEKYIERLGGIELVNEFNEYSKYRKEAIESIEFFEKKEKLSKEDKEYVENMKKTIKHNDLLYKLQMKL
jgi:hypothetical protein